MDHSVTRIEHPTDETVYKSGTIFIPGGGAGLPTIYTTPAGLRLSPVSLQLTLAAINGGPTKVIQIEITDTVATHLVTTIGTGVPAINSGHITVATRLQNYDSAAPPYLRFRGLPENLLLNPGDVLTFTIINGGASDQLTQVVMRAKQWIVGY